MIVLVGRCGLERLATALDARNAPAIIMPADPNAIAALTPTLVYADLFDAAWSVPLVNAALAGRPVVNDLTYACAALAALSGLPLVLRAPRRPPLGSFGLERTLPADLDAAFAAAEALLAGHRTVSPTTLWARHGVVDDGVLYGPGHGEAALGDLGKSRLDGRSAADIEAEALLAWRESSRGRGVKAVVVDLDGVLIHGELASPDFAATNPAWSTEGDAEAAWWRAPRALHQALRVCRSRGLAIALCTRNDPKLVESRFRLREGDDPWTVALRDALFDHDAFDVVEAGFGLKSAACLRIASRLGVRPDSLAFFDDNELERAEVRQNGAGVRVIDGPVACFPNVLLDDGAFVPWIHTDTAGLRVASWRVGAAIATASEGGEMALLAFLHGLQIEVSVRRPRPEELDRVRELVARTTQLRLTGAPLPDPLPALWVATCRDRMTEHGIVAVAWCSGGPDVRILDELVVSCRTLPLRIAGSVLARVTALEPGLRVERVETGMNAASRGLLAEAEAGEAPWVRFV